MPIDPTVESLIAAAERNLSAIRTALGGTVVVPPVEPTTTPVSITNVTTKRLADNAIDVAFTLAGTPSRIGRYAISVVPGGWQEFPAPVNEADRLAGTVTVTVNVKPTAGILHFHVWDQKAGAGDWVIRQSIPYTGTTPPIVVPPVVTPPNPGSGVFTFKTDPAGSITINDGGKLFIPIGVNVPGPNGYWGGGFTPVGKANRLRDTWGWNFIRLFEQRPGGGDASFTPSAHNAWSLASVVDEYTAAGYVVMLDWHQYGFGAMYGPANTAEMITVWTAWANQFKNNPRVWFELANEPEATYHSYKTGAANDAQAKTMMAARWYDAFAPVVKAIRATGATNMIVVNDSQSGMGCDDFWKMGPSTGSAIMMRGADLLAQDVTGNMLWDVHVYDAFGWAGPEAMGDTCLARYSDSQRDDRLIDYVKRVWATTGRPVFAGEFGWQRGESAVAGVGFHGPYKPRCGSRTLLAQQSLTRVAGSLKMGGAQWPGFQLCSNGTDAYDANSLLPCGLDWWTYCQKAKALMAAPAAADTTAADVSSMLRTLSNQTFLVIPHEIATHDADDFGAAAMAMPQRNTTPSWL